MKKLHLKSSRHLCQQFKFSMTEVVLALVVVILGIFGVIGSIPIGIDSHKTAMGTSFATDSAEQFLRFSAAKIKKEWSWINVYANERPGIAEPGHDEWNKKAPFVIGNMSVYGSTDLDESQDENRGFFLLEEFTQGHVDFTAVLRVWKDRTVNSDLSENVQLNVEISWPASVPYSSPERKKEIFSLRVYKVPEISLSDVYYSNCTITKDHGGGFTTTINSVTKNADDPYIIELEVEYNGCTDPDCLQILDYIVQSSSAYDDVSVTGDGSSDSVVMPTTADDELSGFKILFPNGIGGDGDISSFNVSYTLPELEDQGVAVVNEDNDLGVDFTVADFDYIYQCFGDESTVENDGDCPDIEYDYVADLLIVNDKQGEVRFGCNEIQVRTTDSSRQINRIIFRSRQDLEVTEWVMSLNIHDDWVTVPIPDEALPLKDIRVQIDLTLTEVNYRIKSYAYCSEWDESDPVFPNPEVTLNFTPEVDDYFCIPIGSENMPVNNDDENLTYEITGGPSWLYWNAEYEQVAGTPTESGTFTWTLTVSDGCSSDSTELTITVDCPGANLYGPVWPHEDFTWTPSSGTIRVDSYFCKNLGILYEPVDGDGTLLSDLTITVCDGPEWLYWTGSQIAGTPVEAGTFTWTLCASDGCHETSAIITITVDP